MVIGARPSLHQDWQYDEAKVPGFTRKRREGGWFEVHAGGNSTISYVLPWVATEDNYNAHLQLHMHQVTALSSVNDMEVLKAESSEVSGIPECHEIDLHHRLHSCAGSM